MKRDKYGIEIIPSVATVAYRQTVKVERFTQWTLRAAPTEKRNAVAFSLLCDYVRQARAILKVAMCPTISLYENANLLSKAAYSVRQANKIEWMLKNQKEK